MKRELREGQLTQKDMSVLRESDAARVQAEKTGSALKDYSLQHVVQIGYAAAEPDRDLLPFSLKIDDKKYTLSWGELRDMDRAGFFRRDEGNPHLYRPRFYDGHKVMFDTGLNDDAERDMIFRLYTDTAEVFLDWYEFLRYTRFI